MPLKYLNIVFFVFMVFMNYLANALPINNKTTGELSAQYPNLFTPAGITFSIWGVIYLLLLVFIVIQLREENKYLNATIGWAFAISCILNASWILAWHYEKLPLSMLIMVGLLITLIYINLVLKPFPMGITRITFGIYLGWISIATIANFTALLVNYNWGGWGISQEVWAIIMVAIGAIISSLAIIRLENPFQGLAVMWAFLGIIIKRQADYNSIVMTAFIAMVVVGMVSVIIFFRKVSFH